MVTVQEKQEGPTSPSPAVAGKDTEPRTAEEDDSQSSQSLGGEFEKAKRDAAYEIVMSQKEASRIRMFRFMVAGMLFMTAAVTVLAYIFLSRQENQNFETAYDQFARTLADAATAQQKSLRDALEGLSNELTGYAQTSNQEWPFVTLPLFESYALSFFDHSSAEMLGVNNIVPNDLREKYENWTTLHYKEWVHESHMIRYGNLDRLDQDESRFNPFISKKTADGFVPDDERPFYFARTSQSPPLRAYGPSLNMNPASLPGNAGIMEAVIALKNETLVTGIKPFEALPEDEHQTFHSDSNADNPHSFIQAPVYRRVRDPDSGLVATLTSPVAWDASMQNLLPETVHGIVCVIRNNCNQSFTYQVSGPDAFYLGRDDMHSADYDSMEVTVNLSPHSHPDFTTTPDHCQYTMHIFPTDTFKDDYTTAMPMTFAIVVAATFTLVAVVFFVYDWLVQRRNTELARTAAQSNKLVSSLFPEEIKDALLKQQDAHSQTDKPVESRLAKVYPDATIMFADLSGFTQWSSTREPEQVFELLETLYSSFDAIAAKRRVYKVETIGDCYVAATGLPEPQKDHAVRMVRFASDCASEIAVLTTELAASLGEDTSNLEVRVGIHSGSVTGGVLRGDKSRFQLFGDTMNTAARLESNGVPGRIHVSSETADLLIEAGKGSWLKEREDKVVAKGKGEMTTFFAYPAAAAAKTISTSDGSVELNA